MSARFRRTFRCQLTAFWLIGICGGTGHAFAQRRVDGALDNEVHVSANVDARGFSQTGTTISLVPVSTSAGSINGDTITLPRGVHGLEFEVRFSSWDPDNNGTTLLAWQAMIDSSGFTSGLQGSLAPTLASCTTDGDCTTSFGGICSNTGVACNVNSDCPESPIEACQGPSCGFPTDPTNCTPGFIYINRPDYVFIGADGDLVTLDMTTPDYTYASVVATGVALPPPDPFPAGGAYAGTLRLETSADAAGEFTVGFRPGEFTILVNQNNQFIPNVTLVPAKIRIPEPTIEFRPVGGVGNDITVTAGSTVTLELYVSRWTPLPLNVYDIFLDVASYTNGIGTDLAPPVIACTGNAECEAAFGPGAPCMDVGLGQQCMAAFIDQSRGDFIFAGEVAAAAVDLGSIPDYRWGARTITSSVTDAGGLRYAGSLVVDVPAGAAGTYIFGFDAAPDTTLLDDLDQPIAALHVPAKINVGSCGPSAAPVPQMSHDTLGTPVVYRKSRYLSIAGGDPGQLQAIRLTFASLPAPFDTWNGTQLWVGEPFGVCELASQDPASCTPSESAPGYLAATLQCDPHVMDWTLLRGFCSNGICHGSLNAGDPCVTPADCPDAVIHVQHEAIVPSTLLTTTGPIDHAATYDIQFVNALCDMGAEGNFSPPLPIATSGWADLAVLAGAEFLPPDDLINVFDITATFQKFLGDPLAPSKTVVDLVGASTGPEPKLDHLISTLELVFVLDAFGGAEYPFPPGPVPTCP